MIEDLKAETLQSLYSEVQSLKGQVAELAIARQLFG